MPGLLIEFLRTNGAAIPERQDKGGIIARAFEPSTTPV